jgi:FkbM family methyltransferase
MIAHLGPGLYGHKSWMLATIPTNNDKEVSVRYFSLLCAFGCCFLGNLGATYYSQVGQDKYVHEHFFRDRKGGVFVELGAYDGITGSNACFFEREMGWTGLCVEPSPVIFEKLRAARTCPCVQAAVAPQPGKVSFLQIPEYADQLSGIIDSYHPLHKQIIDRVAQGRKAPQVIEVECVTFNDLMTKHNIQHIDFLSLDTEGGEYEILKSINWDKVGIDVITVEDKYNDTRIQPFLESKGMHVEKRLVQDVIYVRNGLPNQG